jgi:dephospho-CoA kinase
VLLAKMTFGKPDQLAILNNIVHPRVADDYSTWAHHHATSAYVLREAALLYESGAYAHVDSMIVVSAPRELRIDRVLARDPHRTREDVEVIMLNQLDENQKISRADFIIYNDEQHMIIPQVLELHQKFIAWAN